MAAEPFLRELAHERSAPLSRLHIVAAHEAICEQPTQDLSTILRVSVGRMGAREQQARPLEVALIGRGWTPVH